MQPLGLKMMHETAELVNPVLVRAANELEEPLRTVVSYLPSIRAGTLNRRPQVRPLLVRLGYEFNRSGFAKIIPICASVELLNNSTYVIDDLLDDCDYRAGYQSVHSKFGNDPAIIAGMLLRELAERKVLECNSIPIEERLYVITALNAAHSVIYRGQFEDQQLNTAGEVTAAQYLQRCGKISGTFIEKCVTIGAHVGGSPPAELEAISRFGFNYGIALQVRNDLMDFLFPETFRTNSMAFKGESHSDFRDGKQTLPLIVALQNASEEDADFLRRYLGKKKIEREVLQDINAIIEDAGGFFETKRAIRQYADLAIAALGTVKECNAKKGLVSLANLTDNVIAWKFSKKNYVNRQK